MNPTQSLLISIVAVTTLVLSVQAQVKVTAKLKSPRIEIYEDEYVRIPIPSDWHRANGHYPALGLPEKDDEISSGNSILQAEHKLILQKDGFTLGLAYKTRHASGIIGGRFNEAFRIPWLDGGQAGWCSLTFTYVPQPASRVLLFENMVIDTGSPEVREHCSIPKDLTMPGSLKAANRGSGEERWFGGFFTSNGDIFFDEDRAEDQDCGSKVYSLTSSADTTKQLPSWIDPHVSRIVQEAVNIVDSITYKRCKPLPWVLPLSN